MNKLTNEHIDSVIVSKEFKVFSGRLTVCVLTLKNGFLVTGEASCVAIENFDEKLGQQMSYDRAKTKVWELEGYLLRGKVGAVETA